MNEFSWQFPSGAGPSCGDRNDSAGCDSQIQKDKKRLIHFENCSSVYRLKKTSSFQNIVGNIFCETYSGPTIERTFKSLLCSRIFYDNDHLNSN